MEYGNIQYSMMPKKTLTLLLMLALLTLPLAPSLGAAPQCDQHAGMSMPGAPCQGCDNSGAMNMDCGSCCLVCMHGAQALVAVMAVAIDGSTLVPVADLSIYRFLPKLGTLRPPQHLA
jgi:hypothetical protein